MSAPRHEVLPQSGWCISTDDGQQWVTDMNDWLSQHTHGDLWGRWIWMFEGDFDEAAQQKQEIVSAIAAGMSKARG